MTIEKLRNFEPLFGAWYIENMVAQGRSSVIYRVSRTVGTDTEYLGLKTIRFPRSERDFSRVMESGKYNTAEEYLSVLEASLEKNMQKMMALRANKNVIRFDNYKIVRDVNCFHVIILMELLTPLSDYLSPDKINSGEIAKMGSDLCKALAGFRQAGIMHREIKPENIFVDGYGNYKLGDFGIAAIDKTGEADEISNYLAPEVLRKETNDYCSDVYSLGILMYKFINNNRMPFLPDFPAPISLADRQRAFERRMSGELLTKPANADLSLAKIIFKASAFRSEDRYADPRLLDSDLQRYLAGLSMRSAADVPTQVIPKANEYRIADEGDVLFGSYAAKKGAAEESTRAREEFSEAFSDDDETDTQQNKKLIVLIPILVVILIIVFIFVFKAVTGTDDETTAAPTTDQTSVSAVQTTAPTTEAPTTTAPPATTEAPTTTETTTTEPTTTEPTTEETTTTEPPTTAETTTEAQPTAQSGPLYTATDHSDGDENDDGRIYTKVRGASANMSADNGLIEEVSVRIKDLGTNPYQAGTAYICQVSAGTVLLKEEVYFDCVYDEDAPGAGLTLEIDVSNNEVYYEVGLETYIVFEEGAIETDTAVNLPFQVNV